MCADDSAACSGRCNDEYLAAIANLRGANKFATQAAATANMGECEGKCGEVKSQCDFEALLKIIACLGLASIVVCVAVRANVNFFVDQGIAAMEQTIAREAAELTRKAKKEEQKHLAKSPAKKKGQKALQDEDAGADIEVRSHTSDMIQIQEIFTDD